MLSVNPSVRWQETRNLHILEPVRSYYAARQPVAEAGDLRLFELDGADPMAFPAGEPARPLPIVRVPAGAKVDLADLPQGGDVVINYLWYEGIRVTADGEPMLHPKIFDMLEYAALQGAGPVGLTTNGSLLTEAAAKRLLASGLFLVDVSLDDILDDLMV